MQRGATRNESPMMEAEPGSFERRVLGRTGLEVGRLGISSSYGVPGDALERAFERGVNYIYWGSRRTASFGEGLKRLRPQRDRFVLVIQSYTRVAGLMAWSLERALRALSYDHADILLLGMWNKPVAPKILDAARQLKQRDLVRFLAVSTHQRTLVPHIATANDFDIVHFRYNAAHPGAEKDIFPNLPRPQPSRLGCVYGYKLGATPRQVYAARFLHGRASASQKRACPNRHGLLPLRPEPPGSGRLHDRPLELSSNG